jgi:cephalosporin-C deacetylase
MKKQFLLFLFVFLPSLMSAEVIWSGEQPIDWSKGQVLTLGPSSFASAAVNDVLRFNIKFTGDADWPQLLLYKGNGSELADATPAVVSAATTNVRYTLTAAMLSGLKSAGLIVTGMGFTLTSVQIIPSSEVSVLEASVPVENGWEWFEPDQPKISVDIINPAMKESEAHVELIINTDRMQAYTTLEKTETIAARSKATVAFDPELEPGFYQCTAMVNDDAVRTFIFGVNPDKIVCPPDKQDDFGTFWQKKKDELAATPMDVKMTEIPDKSTANRKVYLIEVRSLSDATGDVFMRAYYAEPVAPGKYPSLIHYCGYDVGTITPYCMSGDDLPGYIEMYVSIRGQFLNNRAPYTNLYGDYFSYGFGNRDNYFYCGAYLDAVRAIDFICSRERALEGYIFAEGSSQGGALTIAAAALSDGRLKAIAPGVPSMGDFPDNFQMTAWPASAAMAQKEMLGMTEEEMYQFLSYFDTKNLATMVRCPVYLNYSLQDDMCPPRTHWAFLNNAKSKVKKTLVNVTDGHKTADNWTGEYMNFFYERIMTPDDDEVEGDVNGDGVIDVADIASVIDVMAGATVPDGSSSETADVNGDGVVDVADIAAIIDIMAGAPVGK